MKSQLEKEIRIFRGTKFDRSPLKMVRERWKKAPEVVDQTGELIMNILYILLNATPDLWHSEQEDDNWLSCIRKKLLNGYCRKQSNTIKRKLAAICTFASEKKPQLLVEVCGSAIYLCSHHHSWVFPLFFFFFFNVW